MARRILDEKLMEKVAEKLGKRDLADVNKIVSRKASQLGISSEAALVLVAKENGIGSAVYQRKLDPAKQAEVREALPSIFTPRPAASNAKRSAKGRSSSKHSSVTSQCATSSDWICVSRRRIEKSVRGLTVGVEELRQSHQPSNARP